MKNILLCFTMTLVLFTLAACGGGGGGGEGSGGTNFPAATTLKINLTGTLPASTAISGVDFTLTLPENVTPAVNSDGSVSTGVVSSSGTFAGTTFPPLVYYTAATAGVPGKMKVTFSSLLPAGISQGGEVASIVLQLSNGVIPTVGSFGLSAVSVYDVTVIGPISGMGAIVASVTS
ncbi:MAG: hypothetical protein PHF56_22125 [Desulfuromonadaceae bacterium]|nr:hypothetical protein [Desulfuromonadaceae bacterium]